MGSRNNNPGRIVKGLAKQATLKEASGVWTLDEALQAHRANQWPQPNLLQPIPKSLRFKGSTGNSYLKRTPPRSSGDTGTFTLSVWIKLGKPNTDVSIYAADNSSASNIDLFRFKSDGGARFLIETTSGGSYYYMETPAMWRDPSAWYHWVIVVDTRQSTDSNRVKIYVNGVQQTISVSGGVGTYPPQGYKAKYFQTAGIPTWIGAYYDGAANFDGQLAEFNFVDGHAVSPALFGQAGTDGIWIPKPYAGSYGTNGFYLPFINNSNSQTLGYDYSNFSTYDDSKDPLRGNVTLHLTGNGPAGGQNSIFTDSSTNNYTVTRNGSVTQGSFSPFSLDSKNSYNPAIHGASMYQAAVDSDFPSFPTGSQGSNFTFSGDFTMEGWVFYTGSTGDTSLYVLSDGSTYLAFNISMSAGVFNIYLNSGSPTISPSHDMVPNAWNHVALVRSGSTITVYTNGISKGTTTNSSTLGYTSLTINRCGGGVGGVTRYVSNFRVVKAAVYTSTFTPARRPLDTKTNNLIRYNTEDFARWAGGQGFTITPSAEIAPDGTPTASLCVPSTTSESQNVAGIINSPTGVNTFSVYAKSAGYRYVQVLLSRTADNDNGYVTYDLQTGTVYNSSVWTGSVENAGGGWYRLVANTSSFPSTANNSNVRWFVTDGTNSRGPSFTGNGSSGVYLWGAQAESGASATAYTPVPENFSTAPSLLLKFDNGAVVDSAGTTNLSLGSTVTVDSAARYGSGSIRFDGSSSAIITIPPSANTAFGTDDFTMEFWWRSNGSQGSYATVLSQDFTGSPGSTAWKFAVNGGSQALQFTYGSSLVNIGQNVLSAPNPNDSQWHHIAASRSKSTLRLFMDGALVGIASIPIAQSVGSTSINTFIGYNPRDNVYLNGWIDDLRITKGVARYTSDFTPLNRALPDVGGKSFNTINVNAGTVRSFTTTGTTAWTAPSDVSQVEVLVVGGGGSGGGGYGGGGGAGGLIYNSAYPVTPGLTYTVTVGAGGTAPSGGTTLGNNGSNSVFGSLIAIGGGGGGSGGQAGKVGGSGGGSSYVTYSAVSGTAGQGFAGGFAPFPDTSSTGNGAGGGGGAGQIGFNSVGTSADNGGNGGNGLQFSISGTPTYYAGGGGGGSGGYSVPHTATSGGLGGGAAGGIHNSGSGSSATANTGGGGGGGGGGAGGGGPGGAGGSGIVILRYTTAAEYSSSTDDSLVDSPTIYGHDYRLGGEVVGNYAVINSIDTETDHTISGGGLTLSKSASNWSSVRSTIGFNSGKWYFEATYNASWDYAHVGVLRTDVDTYATQANNTGYVGKHLYGWAYQQDQRVWNNDIDIGGSLGAVRAYAGDTAMVAVDMDSSKIWFGVNGVWFNSGNPAAGTNAAYSNLSGTVSPAFSVYGNSSGISVNFGQRPFKYSAPAGFNSVNTKNFPNPSTAAQNPNQYFDVVTYTGTGSTRTISGLNFQPDFVWIKNRTNVSNYNHSLYDSVRGATKQLTTGGTDIEDTQAAGLTAFNSNGFAVGSYLRVNANGDSHAAWCWKAGSATVTNTAGSISSQVSANTTSGFSIVTYTGTGANGTVGHGLDGTPNFILWKALDDTYNWDIYHSSLGHTASLIFTTAGTRNVLHTAPTATTIPVTHTYTGGSANGKRMVAYCWKSVAGFSQFGSYIGSGVASGPFIYTGFRPRFIIIKRTDTTGAWSMFDTARSTYNGLRDTLYPHTSAAEAQFTASEAIDALSNGFKINNTYGDYNTLSGNYVYMAFAEAPFKTTRAR